MNHTVLQIDPRDNVLIALQDLRKGDRVSFSDRTYDLVTDVPAKHKFSTEDLELGDAIKMYGVLVGTAREPIRAGEAVTTRNTGHEASPYREKALDYTWTPPNVDRWREQTFLGYQRSDGQVGTRNYWLVAPLVFCENRNIDVMKQAFEQELGLAPPKIYRQQIAEMVRLYSDGSINEIEKHSAEQRAHFSADPKASNKVFKNIDGIKFLMHEGGCGGTREDSNNLCGLLAGYIHHPNVAGVTVLSLGCQNSQVSILQEQINRRDVAFKKPLLIFEQQQSGSEFKMLSQ